MNNIVIRKGTLKDCKELAIVKENVWKTTYTGIYSDEKISNFDFVKQEKNLLKL